MGNGPVLSLPLENVESISFGREPDPERTERALIAAGVRPSKARYLVRIENGLYWAAWWLTWVKRKQGLDPNRGFLAWAIQRAAGDVETEQQPPDEWLEPIRARVLAAAGERKPVPAPTAPTVIRPAAPAGPTVPEELAPLWVRVLAAVRECAERLTAQLAVWLDTGRPVAFAEGVLTVALPSVTADRLRSRREQLLAALAGPVPEVRELRLVREGAEGSTE